MTKFKENFKKLWSLKTKNASGFTLVELIVVIAILAILAGIAVPAYSGYVEKAEKAADEQLLATVNTAFASACAINGDDVNEVDAAKVELIGEPGKKKIDISSVTPYQEAFEQFYEGNGESTFKGIDNLVFHPQLHQFIDGDTTYSYTFAGSSITLKAENVAVLAGDNAFSKLGSAALLGEVGNLENLIELGAGEEILESVKQSDDFLLAIGSYAGMEQGVDETDDVYLDRVAAYVYDPNNEDAVYSAQVMYAASQAAGVTDEQISALFTYNETQGVTGRIQGSTNAETMANAALAYGMYVAYAEKNDIDTSNISNFSTTLGTKEFCDYVASNEGQTDLEAYMAAMNMISDNTSNSEITSSILANGINGNIDLEALMREVMGN